MQEQAETIKICKSLQKARLKIARPLKNFHLFSLASSHKIYERTVSRLGVLSSPRTSKEIGHKFPQKNKPSDGEKEKNSKDNNPRRCYIIVKY